MGDGRGGMGDGRWTREAAGRRYRTAFDTQSTPDLASEANLHKWPSSGSSYGVAHFWDISSDGPVLGHPLHNVARFWASLPAHPCSRISRRFDRKPQQEF